MSIRLLPQPASAATLRQAPAPFGSCPDCRGTLVVTDDGSVTGRPGASIPCCCTGV